MQASQNNKSLKIVISILSLVLLANFFYMYRMSSHSKSAIVSLRSEKTNLKSDLEKIKLTLDKEIEQKGYLNKQLLLERTKVVKLLQEIDQGKFKTDDINKFKTSSKNLELRIGYLLNEIENYKKQIDSAKLALNKSSIKNETLTNKNKDLSNKLDNATKKISKASKLSYYNLNAKTFKIKTSGEQILTDKASKINSIFVSFFIGENELVAPQNKTYLVQILDANNNVIGPIKSTTLGEKIQDYSAIADIKYKNKTIKIEKNIPVQDLMKGIYTINVFDDSYLILNSTLILK